MMACAKGWLLWMYFGLAVLVAPSHADDTFKLSGFGSLGVVHENLGYAGFTRNTTQPQDETNNTSYLTDSILGVQGNWTVTPQWEAAAQLVLRDQKNPTLNRSFEWAYVKWRPDEQYDVRIGRVGFDSFMLSDYRNVGFAQTWVRPPNEFYGWIPVYSVNGADATYHFRSGDVHWQLKGQYGDSRTLLPLGTDEVYDFRAKNVWDISLRAENGPWQFMGAVAGLQVTTEGVPSALSSGLQQIIGTSPLPSIRSEAQQLQQGLWTKGASLSYTTLGMSYQKDLWQVQAEIAKIDSDSPILPQGTAGYIMAGRRFADLTPYVIVSAFHPDHKAIAMQNNWGVLGASAAQLQKWTESAYSSYRIDQRSLAFGTRWDFGAKTALKLQWDRKWIGARGYGLWQIDNTDYGMQSSCVNVFSAVVDFVF